MEKKNKIISEGEKKTIAYHEAGHATASWYLKHADSLLKVSIVPRGRSLGAAWYLPEENVIYTKEQFIDRLCATLAGRASEEINFGKISSGALDDLEKVTKQAYTMVAYYGLSDKVGNLSFYDSTGQYESSFQKPYSEATAQLIDQEVKNLVEAAYERTKKILIEHQDELEELAELLLKKEVVYKDDLVAVFGERKFVEEGETASS
jgi:cell division protease FtsH